MKADWEAIRAEYIARPVNTADLAAKYGVTVAALKKRAERGGWFELRGKVSATVVAAADAKMLEQRVDELTEFNLADLRIAKAIRSQVAAHLRAAQTRSGIIPADELATLMRAQEAAQRVGRLALGATTSNSGVSSPNGGPVEVETVDARAALRAKLGLT